MVDPWAIGKLFGYSDPEISKYSEAHGYPDGVENEIG
jgi:hypothetical protein